MTDEVFAHPNRRPAIAAGFYGTAAMALVAALVHSVFLSFPFPSTAVAQTIVGAPSGAFDSFFISRIGHWAGYLTLIIGAILFVCSGALIGWFAVRLPGSRGAVWLGLFGLLWLVVVVLYAAPDPALTRAGFAVAFVPIAAFGALVAIRSYSKSVDPAVGAEPLSDGPARIQSPETPLASSRRYFLKASGVGAAGIAIGLANLGVLLGEGVDPGTKRLNAADLTPPATPTRTPGDAAFDSIVGLSPEVTPVADFYTVDKDLINPTLDGATWNLQVHGSVAAPKRFSLNDLRGMRVNERFQTLECISNPVGGRLISTGKFAGVEMADIIKEVRPSSRVKTVIFRAAGGYSESIPIDLAMDPNTWVVIGLNDHLLPRVHGFPARVLSLGTYGMKNPKWLTEMELSEDDVYEGYWEVRGWSAGAQVQTMSRFDAPSDRATVSSPVTFAGIASAADRGISKVEVSTDGGTTWTVAQLKSPLSDTSWRLWRYVWSPPKSGSYRCVVRAYDGAGKVQGQGSYDPFPRGTAGVHVITVTA
jgi:DMSO/TMAO reductase YedYZ molybdopterin-dependent catalytic subunit